LVKRRFLLPLLLSVLLHAAGVAVAWLVTRPQGAAAGPQPIELTLIEVSLPPPPAPAEPATVQPARPAPRAHPLPASEHARPAEVAPKAPPVVDAPFATVPRPTTLPSATLSWTLDAGTLLEEEATGLHAPAVSVDLIGELTRATVGRGKVDRGLVHPYYSQLGKVLLKNWDADRAVSSAGLKGFVEQMGESTKAWNNIWREKAEVFGKSGSPFDAPANVRGRAANDRLIPGQDLAARREVAKVMSEQMKSMRRAQIRVTQAANGKLLKVELVKPSNDSNVDRQALTDVRAAAESLPPPPEEALSGRTSLVSLWEFELVVSITPPIPTFTFEFDEVLGFVDARMPLDRRIYKKVRLVAVE
jgi:TonB family protein